MNCVTDVVKVALAFAGGPNCCRPTTSYAGSTSRKDVRGIPGICETSVAGCPVASEERAKPLRVKPLRVKPKRNWLTLLGVKFQLCSAAALSARVRVLP